jgi:hypothetical protein
VDLAAAVEGVIQQLEFACRYRVVGRLRDAHRVAGVGEDFDDEREHRPRLLVENQRRAIPILDIRGVNGDAQQQAERIYQDVVVDALGLFARVVADRVDLDPPFSADLTVLLSMMAAVGLPSLPPRSRQATYRW